MTPLRRRRIAEARKLKKQGLTSAQIGAQMGLAPTTVRDYLNDPQRRKARKRQSRYSVVGVSMPAGGTPIESVRAKWERGAPAKGVGMGAARKRGRQLRAIIGSRVGR